MSKDIDLNDDDYEFENFDDDLPPWPGDLSQNNANRKPIEQVADGVLNAVKTDVLSLGTLKHMVTMTLPTGYAIALNQIEEGVSGVKDVYKTAVNELKPVKNFLRTKARELSPESKKKLPKFIQDKLEDFTKETYEDYKFKTNAELQEESQEYDVAQALKNVFEMQSAQRTAELEEQRTDELVDKLVDLNQSKDQLKYLNGIAYGISALVGYQDNVLVNYHRKTLELQYRQYFVAKNTLDVLSVNTQKLLVEVANIVKNTALPDIVKMRSTELMGQLITERMMTGTVQTAVEYLKGFKSILGTQASDFVKGALSEKVSMFGQMQSGVPGETGYNTTGGLLGSILSSEIQRYIAASMGPAVNSAPLVKNLGGKLLGTFSNVPQKLNMWSQSETSGTGFGSRIIDSIKSVVPKFFLNDAMDGDGRSLVQKAYEPTHFDNMTWRTINEAIPTLLSENVHWTKAIATGEIDSDKIAWSHERGGITTQANKLKDAKRMFVPTQENLALRKELNEFMDAIGAEKDVISDDARKALMRQLLSDNARNYDFDPVRYSKYEAYKDSNASDEVIQELQNFFISQYDIDEIQGKVSDDANIQNNLGDNVYHFGKLTSHIADVNSRIRAFSDIYGRDTLRNLNLSERVGKRDRIKQSTVWDMMLEDLGSIDSVESIIRTKEKERQDEIDTEGLGFRERLKRRLDQESERRKKRNNKILEASDDDVDVGFLGASPSITYLLNYLRSTNGSSPFIGPMPQPAPTQDPSFVGPMPFVPPAPVVNPPVPDIPPVPQPIPSYSEFDFTELRSKPIPVNIINDYISVKDFEDKDSEDCCSRIIPVLNEHNASVLERMDKTLILIQEMIKLSALKANPDSPIPDTPPIPDQPVRTVGRAALSVLGNIASKTFKGTMWYLKKSYGIQKALVKGAFGLATLPFKKFGGGDIYVQGDEEPTLKASMIRRGLYTDVNTNKVVKTIDDITGPVTNAKGETVLTQEEFDLGISESSGKSAAGMLARGAGKVIGGYFSLATMPYRWAYNKTFGSREKERFTDIYLNGQEEPKLKASDIRKGRYLDYGTNKVIKSPKDITGEVHDLNGKVIISEEEYNESDGLFDATGRKIVTRKDRKLGGEGFLSKLSEGAGSLFGASAKMLGTSALGAMAVPLKFYSLIGNLMINGIKSIFSSKKGGKKAEIGESFSELLIVNKEQLLSIKNIESMLINAGFNKKDVSGDVDGDGIRDNSFEDLRRKEALKDKGGDKEVVKETKSEDNSGHWAKLFGLFGTAITAIGSIKDSIIKFLKAKMLKDGASSLLDSLGDMGGDGRGRGRHGMARKLLGYGASALKVGLKLAPYTRVISAYTFASHLKKASKGYGPLAVMRMSQYGIDVAGEGVASTLKHDIKNLNFIPFYSVNTNPEMIIQLEDLLLSKVKRDKNSISFSSNVDMEELWDIFGVDPEDERRQMSFDSWFNKRFLKVFEQHVHFTNTKTFLNIDDGIAPAVALEYISNVSMLNQTEIFENLSSPFEDGSVVNQGPAEVKEKVEQARLFYTKKRSSSKEAPVVKTNEDGSTTIKKDNIEVKETHEGNKVKLTEKEEDLNYIDRLMRNLKNENYLGVTMSLLGVGFMDRSKTVNDVTIPQYVRLKTYGLEQLEANKVNGLLNLEDLVFRSISYSGTGQASWSGNFNQIIEKFSDKFSLGSVQERYNSMKWFEQRFLPTYLNYLTILKQKHAISIEAAVIKIKGIELKELLKAVVNSKTTVDTVEVSVWDTKVFCYDNVKINEDKDGLLKYIDGINDDDKVIDIPEIENTQLDKNNSNIALDAYAKTKEVASDVWGSVASTAAGAYAATTKAAAETGDAIAKTYEETKAKAGARYENISKQFSNIGDSLTNVASSIIKPITDKRNRVVTAVNTNLPPEARAFLDTIASTESPGYNVIFGGKRVESLGKHPGIYVPITKGPNAGKKSSAAGRYQFLEDTWNEESAKLGITDFSPASQDAVAWNYAKSIYKSKTKRDLLSDISSNNPKLVSYAAGVLNKTWTSLPGGIETTTNPQKFFNTFNKSLENVKKYEPQMLAQANVGKEQPASTTASKAPTSTAPMASSIETVASNQSDVTSSAAPSPFTSNNVVPMFKQTELSGLEDSVAQPSVASIAPVPPPVAPAEEPTFGLSKVSMKAPSVNPISAPTATPKATVVSNIDLGGDVAHIMAEQLSELTQIKDMVSDLLNMAGAFSKQKPQTQPSAPQAQPAAQPDTPAPAAPASAPMRTASVNRSAGSMGDLPVSVDRTRYS